MIRLLICLFLLIQTTFLSAQTFDNPVAYFDFFNQEHSAIAQKNLEYLQYVVHSEDLKVIVEKRLSLLEQLMMTEKKLAALPAYSGDARLKAEMQTVLKTYLSLFNVGFQEIEALKVDAEDSFEKMESYLQAQTAAEKQMAAASEQFLQAQRFFAKTHGIELVEGAQNSEAEQLNNLNNYQRDLYLRAFRIGKLNAHFLSVIDQESPADLEKSRLALAGNAQKELKALQTIGDFNGNTRYRDAVIRQVELYFELAKEDYRNICAVKAKGNQLTEADVVLYNSAIQRVNDTLNPAADQVNEALQELLRNNVPKPAMRGVKQI